MWASHFGGSSCGRARALGTRTQLLLGMWNLPKPGVDPVSSTLAGGFLSSGSSRSLSFLYPLILEEMMGIGL